jgi:hypothetical protein
MQNEQFGHEISEIWPSLGSQLGRTCDPDSISIPVLDIPPGAPIVDTNYTPGLIILARTGVYYTNQAGGVSCLHPIEEGYFVPFHLGYQEWRELSWDLQKLGDNIGNGGWFSISSEDADKVDALFEKHKVPLRVERALLGSSYEAWIYVRVLDLEKCGVEFRKAEKCSLHGNQPLAVLVYENSD